MALGAEPLARSERPGRHWYHRRWGWIVRPSSEREEPLLQQSGPMRLAVCVQLGHRDSATDSPGPP
jgi:hypothetical protein